MEQLVLCSEPPLKSLPVHFPRQHPSRRDWFSVCVYTARAYSCIVAEAAAAVKEPPWHSLSGNRPVPPTSPSYVGSWTGRCEECEAFLHPLMWRGLVSRRRHTVVLSMAGVVVATIKTNNRFHATWHNPSWNIFSMARHWSVDKHSLLVGQHIVIHCGGIGFSDIKTNTKTRLLNIAMPTTFLSPILAFNSGVYHADTQGLAAQDTGAHMDPGSKPRSRRWTPRGRSGAPSWAPDKRGHYRDQHRPEESEPDLLTEEGHDNSSQIVVRLFIKSWWVSSIDEQNS